VHDIQHEKWGETNVIVRKINTDCETKKMNQHDIPHEEAIKA
jgi:hypothetical protein